MLLNKMTPWLCCAILLLLLAGAVKSCISPAAVISPIQIVKSDSVQYWKDVAGREHARAQVSEGNYATLRAYNDKLIDSVIATLKIQGKQLEGITAIGTQTRAVIVPKVDTVLVHDQPALHFSYNDRWIDIDGVLPAGAPQITYITRDSLIFTHYRKRTGFLGLGRTVTYLDGYSINPNSKVTGVTDLRFVTDKPKRFGIGPYIGYGYDGLRWAPSMGISLQYSLIKF